MNDLRDKKTKIMYIITRGIFGGGHTHIFDLVCHLRHHFDVCVAMGVKGTLWDRLHDENIPVYHVPFLVREVSPVMDIKGLIAIIKLLRTVKPDLVTTHSSKAGVLGRLAARLCGIPVIFTAHGWAFTEGVSERKRSFYIRTERMAARWADKIICVSEYDYRLACKYKVGRANQLITIHNGMPLGPQKFVAQPGTENPVRIIMVARFSGQKDQQLLIRAFSQINAEKPIKLDLVGDGPLITNCKKLVQSLGIDDRVNFLGARSDVAELLVESQIFVLTSRWEGFPISILEAMRAGLPVIASDVGGAGESVFEGENGFLIPRGDIETLKSRLKLLLDNPELRVQMGMKSRQRFLLHFTLNQMAEKTAAVYEEIILQSLSRQSFISDHNLPGKEI